jgi:acetyltransferase-like isoleucine patch superfamily enzyme
MRALLKSTFYRILEKLPRSMWGRTHILASGRIGYRRKFLTRNVGKFSYVDPSVMVFGWKNVWIGEHTTVGENVWFNANFRADPHKKIVIGNNCHIAKGSYFSCGPMIRLKDYCFTGFNCNFLGCGHHFDSPLIPYIASGVTEGAAIEIGVNCWLTDHVTVLEGVRIGYGSIIGAGTLVTRDIPPFSVVVGNPHRLLRRFDFASKRWVDLSEWSEDKERSIPTEEEYLEQLKTKYPVIPLNLITSSRRFGWL